MTPHPSEPAVPPGQILREVLRAKKLRQQELADMIGRPHQMISGVMSGKARITGRTALDFESALGISAEYWMYAQANYDLFVARRRKADGVTVFGRATR